jgi:hypothetical protein
VAFDECEICRLPDQTSENAGPQRLRVTCERCGTFEWEPHVPRLTPETSSRQVMLSAFVREQNAVGITPFLQAGVVHQVERRRRPRLRDRALRALAAMVQEFGYDIQSAIPISDNLRLHAISYSADEEELSVLREILEGDGLIKTAGLIPTTVHLTTAGLIQAEELSQPGAAYLQGFVAMSFDASLHIGLRSRYQSCRLPPIQD